MSIDERILKEYPELSDGQKEAIGHTEGPQLIIAGPGSGKTHVLVIRALNILLRQLSQPSELLICTYTEKAAFELRDRISLAAKTLDYKGSLSDVLVGTIHGLSNDFLMRYRHRTSLGNNYEVLDDLTQLLFIFENFDKIVGPEVDEKYLTRWTTRWTAIEGARNYFNKITEELIDPTALVPSPEPFISALGSAYQTYISTLFERNRVDFAHLQKIFYELLQDKELGDSICGKIKYILVDEYQDTNFIQEQLLLQLARPINNICVVGDEDQSLYRFRGATVRNILEFQNHFTQCKVTPLVINYRSHEVIINAYNKFMDSANWSNPGSDVHFRFDKKILPIPEGAFPQYPAVFCIWGESKKDEASRVADLAEFLKENHVVEDFSQIALLLHSVRLDHSGHFLAALEEKGIPVFCPRARGYFENEEVNYMVACFAIILGHYGDQRGEIQGHSLLKMASYIDECIVGLGAYP